MPVHGRIHAKLQPLASITLPEKDMDNETLAAWAALPRSDYERRTLENKWADYHGRDTQQLQQCFSGLLTHYLWQTGYPTSRNAQITDSSAAQLALNIAGWQEPERTIPYSPLLVKSWLEGNLVPDTGAWNGIRYYLAKHPDVPKTALKQMDHMQSVLVEHQESRLQDFTSEAQLTLQLRARHYDIKGVEHLTLRDRSGHITELKRPEGYLYGTHHLTLSIAEGFDAELAKRGCCEEPSLAAIHVSEQRRNIPQAWKKANNLGGVLRFALEQLELSPKQFAQAVDLADRTIFSYLEEARLPTGELRCPSRATFDKMLLVISEKDNDIATRYGQEPIFDAKKMAQFEKAYETTLGDRVIKPDQNEFENKKAEMVVLVTTDTKLTNRRVSELVGAASPGQVASALNKLRNQYGVNYENYPADKLEAARERLAMRGISVELGALRRNQPKDAERGVA